MRTCPKCGDPQAEFYEHVASRCKECHKAAVRARYHERMGDPAFRASERERNRVRVTAKYHEALKHDPEYWQRHVDVVAGYRNRNPEKYRAQTALNNAIRDGRIVKPPACQRCRKPGRVEGHHDDYSRPLRVEWLCRSCHAAEHRKVA